MFTGSLQYPLLPSSTDQYHCTSGAETFDCLWSCLSWVQDAVLLVLSVTDGAEPA